MNSDCVFCSRHDQPPILISNDSLYVMPDKYPLLSGHTLVISREHLACWGAAKPEIYDELEQAHTQVAHFLGDVYGGTICAWENGVSGQSVPHAHLHLMPFHNHVFPPTIASLPDVQLIDDWDAVRIMYERHGRYRFAQLGGQRLVIPGESPTRYQLFDLFARISDIERTPDGFVRRTTDRDVCATVNSWRLWSRSRRASVIRCTDL
ncbi:MAG TPA: HIT family protein [Chloroflexota bacterium]